jgi:hypothetical protein
MATLGGMYKKKPICRLNLCSELVEIRNTRGDHGLIVHLHGDSVFILFFNLSMKQILKNSPCVLKPHHSYLLRFQPKNLNSYMQIMTKNNYSNQLLFDRKKGLYCSREDDQKKTD